MSLYSIVAIAVALAMDAFAVSIAAGINLKKPNKRQVFRMSWHFGLFQALMPVFGWSAGLTFRRLIEAVDHWIAFSLLVVVATHMIVGAFKDKDQNSLKKDPSKGLTLIILSIATSIDALAIGLSISILNISIWLPAGIIGITAALFSLLGLYIGSKAVKISWLSKYAEIIGALVLYFIGFRILYEHLQGL